MKSNQECSTFLSPEQKFNFRGTWSPYGPEPALNTKYDAYIVSENSGDYEVGDWIVRDGGNNYFSHVSVGIFSTIMDCVSENYVSRDLLDHISGKMLLDNQFLVSEINKLKIEIESLKEESKKELNYEQMLMYEESAKQLLRDDELRKLHAMQT